MVTKEMIKTEVDKVQHEYLASLYQIIKALEYPSSLKNIKKSNSNWKKFIESTYGCLKNSPIERGKQGEFEIRGDIQ
ncbi:hypothetical protein H8E88_26435 [candidate division KSB1 bacterium]|nr:hypothetical protein [candidate division KSB1 bacterium]MBL7094454.1 hypothetical protein [candidate division KSB1 bacterium]